MAGKTFIAGEVLTANDMNNLASKLGGQVIAAQSAAEVPLAAAGAASQTADLFQARNSAGTVLARIDSSGNVTAGDGSASGAAFANQGDENTGVFFPAADSLAVTTGGSERLRVDSAGDVGIGTQSPAARLEVVESGSQPAVRITNTGTGNSLEVEDSTNPDSTPFVVAADGQVIVGATQAYTPVAGRAQMIEVNGSSTTHDAASFTKWSNTVNSLDVSLSRSRGSLGTHTTLNSGDSISTLWFRGSDGTSFVPAAGINASVDSTPGTNDMPGRLVFLTTADGASSPTERMRITSAGNVGIGNSNPSTGRLLVQDLDAVATNVTIQSAAAQSEIVLRRAGGTWASPSAVANGDVVGALFFRGLDNVGVYRSVARIEAGIDGTPGTNDMPGRLVFFTVPDGSLTQTERMRIDNAGLITGSGTSLGAWTSYTPTLGGTGWALGNGTATGFYCQIGKIVHFQAEITFGSTSTFGTGTVSVTLPLTAINATGANVSAFFFDTSASATYSAGAFQGTTTTVACRTVGTNGLHSTTNSTTPFTWASTDVIRVQGTYQIA